MQTFYPEFESGQVLTNDHLNQLTTWLNEQQQASRRKLFGIGIVCGLDVTVALNRIRVTAGVAVTSSGHLMCQDEDRSYARYRSYTLPVSNAGDPALDGDDVTVPELLPLKNPTLHELVTDDFAPAPGEPAPGNLTPQFLAGKVVLLLLEAQRVSLKNCDINDCADKGSRWQFTLRTLLISEGDAIALWQKETDGASELMPQDLNWQTLRSKLEPQSMAKLIPGATGANSLTELHNLAAASVVSGWTTLLVNLQASFDVYAYLLRTRFSVEDFPTDPWAGFNPAPPTTTPSLNDLLLGLHRYDALQDAVASYNEFLETANQYEALCCPSPQRFQFHVLLGKPQPPQEAEVPGTKKGSQINFDIGAQPGLPYLRHPFYPNTQLGDQKKLGADLVNLYYRTWLIVQRFSADTLPGTALKVTPSLINAALSNKAIPYYLPVVKNDDLHRNWSPRSTRLGMLNQVHGYSVSPSSPHPLTRTPLQHDFYRVEGVLGRPLGQLVAELKVQQQQLGLSFGIEHVFLPVQDIDSETTRNALLALLLKDKTLVRLFKCKLSDIDVIFLLLLGFLFQLVLALIYLLTRLNLSAAATAPAAGAATSRLAINPAFLAVNASEFASAVNTGDRAAVLATQNSLNSSTLSTFLQKQVRTGQLQSVDVIDTLDEPDDRNGANAALYKQVKSQTTGDLFERVRKAVGTNTPEAQVQQTYQTMRMLQQSERMLQQASVSTVAQFDFDRFDADVSELKDAYQGFRAQRTPSPSADQQAALGAIDSNMSMLANLSSSSLLGNLRSEFTARISKVFSEFMFEGYNKRFPALEHLCGVPRGGTLVLVYTHKSLLRRTEPSTLAAGTRAMAARPATLRAEATFSVAESPTAVMTRASALMTNATRANAAATNSLASMVSARRADAAVSLPAMAATQPISPTATKIARDAAIQRAERDAVLAEREVAAKKAEALAAQAAREADANRIREAQLAAAREAALAEATAAEKREAAKAAKEAAAQAKREAAEIAALEKAAAAARGEAEKAAREADAAKKAEEEARAAAEAAPARDAVTDISTGMREISTKASLETLGLSAALADDDPINDLIVVADFCLPTFCCDSDCADLDVGTVPPPPDTTPPPTSISVSGSIVSNVRASVVARTLTTAPIVDAILKVTDRNKKEISVKMSRGSFLFKVNPGTYTLSASAKGFVTRTETLNITAPLGREVAILLTPDDGKGGIDRGGVIGLDLSVDRSVLLGRNG